jgi:hypothetical protein
VRINATSVGLIVPVVAGLVAVLAAPAALAQAAPSAGGPTVIGTTLPVDGFQAMAADTRHGRLFVSGGRDEASLLVTDFSGTALSTIPLSSSASSLALSADGRTLFAALPGADSIAVIDTVSLKQTALYSTGAGTSPTYVAAGGRGAWFGYGQQGTFSSGIGLLDRHHGTVTLTAEPDFYAAPKVATSPAAPGILLAGEVTISPGIIEEFDITSGSPVFTAVSPAATIGGCQSLTDFAVTADGRDVVAACESPGVAHSYSMAGLADDGTYQTESSSNRVATAGNGRIAVGLLSDTANLDLFSPDNPTPTMSFALGGGRSVYESVYGLAWVSHHRELLAMVYDSPLGSVILYTINFDTR